jgi:CheY-like chemotaxis protein
LQQNHFYFLIVNNFQNFPQFAENYEGGLTMKVLVVIPGDEVSRSVASNLVSLGHEVYEAESKEEVLTFVKGKKAIVDLIILSLAISLHEGRELTQVVRNRWREVKIIALFNDGNKVRRGVVESFGVKTLEESEARRILSLREAINSLFQKEG